MRVSEDFMIAMLGALDDEVGQAAATEIMYKCGYQWGLEDMRSFTRRAQAEFEVELEKMRVGFLLEEWWWPLTITGWGTWRYDFRQKEKGLLYIELYESAVAKSIGDIGNAVCYFYAGMFAAVFSVLSRRNLASVEMQWLLDGRGPLPLRRLGLRQGRRRRLLALAGGDGQGHHEETLGALRRGRGRPHPPAPSPTRKRGSTLRKFNAVGLS